MKSLDELKALKEKAQAQMGIFDANSEIVRVVVGLATCGIASGARPVMDKMTADVKAAGLDKVSRSKI